MVILMNVETDVNLDNANVEELDISADRKGNVIRDGNEEDYQKNLEELAEHLGITKERLQEKINEDKSDKTREDNSKKTESDEISDKMNPANDELMNFLGVRPEEFENKEGEMPPAFKFLESYFPDEESMGEKTRYRSDEVAIKITTLKMLPEIYPELKDIRNFDAQGIIDAWIDNFDKRLTSVQGESRTEFKEILKAMLGGMRAMQQKHDGGVSGLMESMFTTKGGDKNEG